jgi:hypothetical protein
VSATEAVAEAIAASLLSIDRGEIERLVVMRKLLEGL